MAVLQFDFLRNALHRKAGILIVLQNFAKRNTGGRSGKAAGDEKVYRLCAVLSGGKKSGFAAGKRKITVGAALYKKTPRQTFERKGERRTAQ